MAKIFTRITWVDEVLAAAARYFIKTNAGASLYSTVEIGLETTVNTPGTGVTAARLNRIEAGVDTLDDMLVGYTTGGSSTAYTLDTPGNSAYGTLEEWKIVFHATAGATPTLNRDGLGAKALKYYNSAGVKTAAGATVIIANMIAHVVYDGTDYIILDSLPSSSGGSSIANSAISPTTSDVTAAVNTRYIANVSGLTANRNFKLPAGTSGDEISLNISTSDDLYELIVIGDTGITINGGAAATASVRLSVIGQNIRLIATSASNWQVVQWPVMLKDGEMLNGKILPTVVSNDLVLTLLTAAGNTPSLSDPVYVGINGRIRAVTAATSMTLADATNWYNAGSAELATKEIDYFAIAVWDSNSAIVAISAARIPYGRLVSDFSATTTNEKHLGNYANFTATDDVCVIGRFAATLSASAGHVWTVPTYTGLNLVQNPVYETRMLSWTPVITYNGGTTDPTSNTPSTAQYRISGRTLFVVITSALVRGAGNRTFTNFTIPFSVAALTPAVVVDSITATGNKNATASYLNSNALVVVETMANDGSYYGNGFTSFV